MNGFAARAWGWFVAPAPGPEPTDPVVAAPAAAAIAPVRPRRAPTVAVLCGDADAQAFAAGVALALGRALGGRSALFGVVGGPRRPGGKAPALPAAHSGAGRLRRAGVPVTAGGRLLRLSDEQERFGADTGGTADPAGLAAAASAVLGRAAAVADAPAALAIPFPRTAALDRVLAWHDGIVVVPAPDAVGAVHDRALASLALLGRPVAAMALPNRLAGALAAQGLQVPAEAADAVARLRGDRRWHGG